jgi:hypothetical protein
MKNKKQENGLRRPIAQICVAVGLALLAGCASVTYSSPQALSGITIKGAAGAPSQLVFIDTTGFYFLWTLPIVSGDLRWNAGSQSIEGGTSFFQDQVGVEELQNALHKIAESRNCDLVDVNYYESDTSYAGPSYSGAVGTLLGSSHMSVSAVLVPRKTK